MRRLPRLRRSRRALCFGLGSALLLCACGDENAPSTGSCSGSIGGVSIAGPIDASSDVRYVSRPTCADQSLRRFDFSYASGALKVKSDMSGMEPMIRFIPATYPVPPTREWTPLETWVIASPSPRPDLTSGTFTVENKSPRIVGKFHLVFANGSTITCDYDLRKGKDEDSAPGCPDGRLDDDWD